MTTIRVFEKKLTQFRKLLGLGHYLSQRWIGYPLAWVNRRLALRTAVVGVTGSAGKTTTKDVCVTMLEEFGGCGASQRTMNSRLGVVRSLRKLRWFQRYFVIEMSGGRPGELDHSMNLVKPDIGVLTNIGRDHYKAFKSIDGIVAEKAKMVRYLPPSGTAVLNMDDPHVRAIGEACSHRKVWVGRTEGATVRLIDVSSLWPEPLTLTVEHEHTLYQIRTRLYGEHMALPVLCALGVAVALDLPLDRAIVGIANVTAVEGRMQIVEGEDGVVFIRDDWKAPDWTLQAPIEFLRQAQAERKVAIVGSVSDFSADSTSKYKQIARRMREVADLVVFVGPNAHRAVRARKNPDDQSLVGFERIIDAARFLKEELRQGDLVLLKGSAKADHLVRLLYDRYQSVQCWEDRCGLNRFCGVCPKLYEPVSQGVRASISATAPIAWGEPPGKSTVIVGLGNPGTEYEGTPHNMGYSVIDKLVEQVGATWVECPQGWMSELEFAGSSMVMAFKPSTKMNVSGAAVRQFLLAQNGHPQRCILIHDDMDLQLGDVRLKYEGSSAGHNGVKSVLAELGSQSVTRVRVGGRSQDDQSRARQRVLAAFRSEDRPYLDESLSKAHELVAKVIGEQQSSLHQTSQAS